MATRKTLTDTYDPDKAQFNAVVQGVYESLVKKRLGLPSKAPFENWEGTRLDQHIGAADQRKLLSSAYSIATKQGQKHGWLKPGSNTPTRKGKAKSRKRARGPNEGFEDTLSRARKSGKYRVVKVGRSWEIQPMPPGRRSNIFHSEAKAVFRADKLNARAAKTSPRARANPKKAAKNPKEATRAGWCISTGIGEIFEAQYNSITTKWEVLVGGDPTKTLQQASSKEEITEWLGSYLSTIDSTVADVEVYHVAIPLSVGKVVRRQRFSGKTSTRAALRGEYFATTEDGRWVVRPKPPAGSPPVRKWNAKKDAYDSFSVSGPLPTKALATRAASQLNKGLGEDDTQAPRKKTYHGVPEENALSIAMAQAADAGREEELVWLEALQEDMDGGFVVKGIEDVRTHFLSSVSEDKREALGRAIEEPLDRFFSVLRRERALDLSNRQSERDRGAWARKLGEDRAIAGDQKIIAGKIKQRTELWDESRVAPIEEMRTLQGTTRFIKYFQNQIIQLKSGKVRRLTRAERRTDPRLAWVPNKLLTDKLAMTKPFSEAALEVLYAEVESRTEALNTYGSLSDDRQEELNSLVAAGRTVGAAYIRELLDATKTLAGSLGEALGDAVQTYAGAVLALREAEAAQEGARDTALAEGKGTKAVAAAGRKEASLTQAIRPFLTDEQLTAARRKMGRARYQVYSTFSSTLFKHAVTYWNKPTPNQDKAAALANQLDQIEGALQQAGADEMRLAMLLNQNEVAALASPEARDPSIKKLIRAHYNKVADLNRQRLLVRKQAVSPDPESVPYPMSRMDFCSAEYLYNTKYWGKYGTTRVKMSKDDIQAERERLSLLGGVDKYRVPLGEKTRFKAGTPDSERRLERAARQTQLYKAAEAIVEGLGIKLSVKQVDQYLSQAEARLKKGKPLTDRQAAAVATSVLAGAKGPATGISDLVIHMAHGREMHGISPEGLLRIRTLFAQGGGRLDPALGLQYEETEFAPGVVGILAPGAAAPEKDKREKTTTPAKAQLLLIKKGLQAKHGAKWFDIPEVKAEYEAMKLQIKKPLKAVEEALKASYGPGWRKDPEALALYTSQKAAQPAKAPATKGEIDAIQEWKAALKGLQKQIKKQYGAGWQKDPVAVRAYKAEQAKMGAKPSIDWATHVLEARAKDVTAGALARRHQAELDAMVDDVRSRIAGYKQGLFETRLAEYKEAEKEAKKGLGPSKASRTGPTTELAWQGTLFVRGEPEERITANNHLDLLTPLKGKLRHHYAQQVTWAPLDYSEAGGAFVAVGGPPGTFILIDRGTLLPATGSAPARAPDEADLRELSRIAERISQSIDAHYDKLIREATSKGVKDTLEGRRKIAHDVARRHKAKIAKAMLTQVPSAPEPKTATAAKKRASGKRGKPGTGRRTRSPLDLYAGFEADLRRGIGSAAVDRAFEILGRSQAAPEKKAQANPASKWTVQKESPRVHRILKDGVPTAKWFTTAARARAYVRRCD